MCPRRPAEGTGLSPRSSEAKLRHKSLASFPFENIKNRPSGSIVPPSESFPNQMYPPNPPTGGHNNSETEGEGKEAFPSAKQTELTRSRCEERKKPQAAGCLLKAARCSPVPFSPRPAVVPPAFPCKAPGASLPAHSRVDKHHCFVPLAVRPVLCHLFGTSATAMGHASGDRCFSWLPMLRSAVQNTVIFLCLSQSYDDLFMQAGCLERRDFLLATNAEHIYRECCNFALWKISFMQSYLDLCLSAIYIFCMMLYVYVYSKHTSMALISQ